MEDMLCVYHDDELIVVCEKCAKLRKYGIR